MKEKWRGELAVEQIAERQRREAMDALANLRRDIDTIALAAEDLSKRVIKLSAVLLQQIAKGEHEAAQHTAGQIHMMSRLIEQKMLVCIERWRIGLVIADASFIRARVPYRRRLLRLSK